MSALVKGFGCRPIAARRLAPWPASETLNNKRHQRPPTEAAPLVCSFLSETYEERCSRRTAKQSEGSFKAVARSASEHTAHHAADQAAGATAAARMTATASTASAAAALTAGGLVVGVVTGTRLCRCDDFGQQRLVLQLVEETGRGIAARGLPARDHRTGRIIELAGYPTEPLVSYQINRQLSGWNLPPLVIRARGALP